MFSLLFATSFVFAGNIGRAVYGVLTETYNGASIDNPSADDDYAHNWGTPESSSDRIEGATSTSVGSAWWFGVCFDSPQDMSVYTGGRLYFSAKVPTTIDINNAGNVFKVKDSAERMVYFNSDSIKKIDNGSTVLGTKISNDNQWHTYYIELSSFTSLDLTNISYLFIVGNTTNNNTLLIDNVYWTKASSATRSFNVTVKNISDNQVATNEIITWNQSCFRQSWTAAEQYIELDLDQEGSNNWYVKVYLDNGKASRNGLYCVDSDGSEIVLPMAWRISKELIPNSDATFQISKDSEGLLYDSDKTTPDADGVAWAYPWAYFYDISDTALILNDTIIWNLRGCHCFLYTGENWAWQSLANYYDRKPKIYFAADCSNALASLTYTANVVTELGYE